MPVATKLVQGLTIFTTSCRNYFVYKYSFKRYIELNKSEIVEWDRKKIRFLH